MAPDNRTSGSSDTSIAPVIAGGVIGASHPVLSLARYLKETYPALKTRLQSARNYKPDYQGKNLAKFYKNTRFGDVVAEGGVHFDPAHWINELSHGSPVGHVALRAPRSMVHAGDSRQTLSSIPDQLMNDAFSAGRKIPLFKTQNGKRVMQLKEFLASRLFANLASPESTHGTASLPVGVHMAPSKAYSPGELESIRQYLKVNSGKLKNYDTVRAVGNALSNQGVPGVAAGLAGRKCNSTVCYQTPIDILKMLGRGAGNDYEGLNNVLLNPNLKIKSVYNKARLMEILEIAKRGRIGSGLAFAGLLGGCWYVGR